ncbi:hypothetical protein J7K99_03020, partial [bacterium]|nr:hypothetical protein [bacterium]
MLKGVLSAVLLFSAISVFAQNGAITRKEAIRTGLEAIKMTPERLTLKSPVERDSFRLKIVDECMDRPTEVPDILDSLYA